DLNFFLRHFEIMVKAKSLFAEKRYKEALSYLGRAEVRDGLGSFHLGLLELSVLKAAIHSRMKDEAKALSALERAYRVSVSCSLNMPFIEFGEDMRNLTGMALNSKKCAIPRPWLEMIRNKASVYEKKLMAMVEWYHNNSDIGEIPFLGSQELAILASISHGSTREEIAEAFSLSINGVKTIIKAVYAKLGAFNRADAIRIATGMGLLK
ncbi:MAG: LuxR family transcriptional regulator, partial [Treponema sp.]|nr:LuxR family transcriptional regulator [Treponema sp.]